MEDKEKIIESARSRFIKEGFYKTSMDELAKELSMSKKTIYKYYPSKEKLIEAVVEELMHNISGKMDQILSKDESSVMKIAEMLRLLGSISISMGDRWIGDIKLHTPHLWKRIETFRAQKMNSNFKKIIEQGKKEGLFHDKPIEIVMTIFIASVGAVVTPDFLLHNNYSFKDAVEITFDTLLNGILTDKGSRQFYNLRKKQNLEQTI
ncbi:MAG: TetR/AcrR family transcriptional regulator [Bacillota bacterium]